MKRLLSISLLLAFVLIYPANVFAYFNSVVFADVPPTILQWDKPLPTWANINSKWNQPRSSGTNPHRGIDLDAQVGTSVYAVWNGW